MSNKELIKHINEQILGIPQFGFEDKNLWDEFIKTHFSRSGEIENEPYSSLINETLSRAALSQTLNEIRVRLAQLERSLED